jgi:hypothetical protein
MPLFLSTISPHIGAAAVEIAAGHTAANGKPRACAATIAIVPDFAISSDPPSTAAAAAAPLEAAWTRTSSPRRVKMPVPIA